jgi:hypothetical protein
LTSKSPLSGYTLFLDRNFGRYQVAVALRAAGLTIEVHYDHYPQAERGELDDRYWIKEVTSFGWVILTRNGQIRHNPLERAEFIAAGARVFNIRNANATAESVRTCLELAAGRMARILLENQGPFIAGISMRGTLTFIDAPAPAAKE